MPLTCAAPEAVLSKMRHDYVRINAPNPLSSSTLVDEK